MTKLPERPWETVDIDFCAPFPSKEYALVITDQYSRYPEVEFVHSTAIKPVRKKSPRKSNRTMDHRSTQKTSKSLQQKWGSHTKNSRPCRKHWSPWSNLWHASSLLGDTSPSHRNCTIWTPHESSNPYQTWPLPNTNSYPRRCYPTSANWGNTYQPDPTTLQITATVQIYIWWTSEGLHHMNCELTLNIEHSFR